MVRMGRYNTRSNLKKKRMIKKVIPIVPRPYSRVRVTSTGHSYNTPEYTEYKKNLAKWLMFTCQDVGAFNYLEVVFYLPYPKSTPKKNLIENRLHIKKPDCDNLLKGLFDAIQLANLIGDDSGIIGSNFVKLYTVSNPRIEIVFKNLIYFDKDLFFKI